MKTLLSLIMLAVMGLSACSKTTEDDGNGDTIVRGIEGLTNQAVYPHFVEFKVTNLHGKYYYSAKDQCQKCHGEDLLGGESRVSCNKCHTVFPHSEDFYDTNLHGTEYLRNYSSCVKCHKTNNKRELSGINCKKCHNYPHSSQWTDRENHGQASLSANENEMLLDCNDCHAKDSDLRSRYKDLKIAKCDDCHIELPHSTDFKDGDHGGLTVNEHGKCLSCHTNYTRLMPNYEECTMCHTGELTVDFPL